MTQPGTLGFASPPREDFLIRQINDLRAALRELGPSVAKSFTQTVDTLAATVEDLAEAQTALADVVAKLGGLRTFATSAGTISVTRPSGASGSALVWTSTSVDLPGVVVPASCALLVTVSCASASVSPASVTTGENATSILSFDVSGWAGVSLGAQVNSAYLTDFGGRGATSSLSRQYRIAPPPGTYTIRAFGGGYHTSGAPQTVHQFAGVTLVAQVIPDAGF